MSALRSALRAHSESVSRRAPSPLFTRVWPRPTAATASQTTLFSASLSCCAREASSFGAAAAGANHRPLFAQARTPLDERGQTQAAAERASLASALAFQQPSTVDRYQGGQTTPEFRAGPRSNVPRSRCDVSRSVSRSSYKRNAQSCV
jgi:hypothetical protein